MDPLCSFFILQFGGRVCREVWIWWSSSYSQPKFSIISLSIFSPLFLSSLFCYMCIRLSLCLPWLFSFVFTYFLFKCFHLYFLSFCLCYIIFSDKSYNSFILPSTVSDLILNSSMENFPPNYPFLTPGFKR